MTEGKRIFISYSHDSEAHRKWVLELATFLMENGVEVLLDQWDVGLGDDLPAFMERAIRDTDRVLVVCTDNYVEKANSGAGGVGYEKTIVTAEILRDHTNRRKFIPVVRNVTRDEKMPSFLGAAMYIDLSDGNDSEEVRRQLLRSICEIAITKPTLGSSPFIPIEKPPATEPVEVDPDELPSLRGQDACAAFSDRFAQAFPGLRGVAWFDDSETIAERLGILLRLPLLFKEGHLAGWWRGPANLHIERLEHIEGSHFLMDIEELNIRRLAAVNQGLYYRTFVYIEAAADAPTGLYRGDADDIARQVETFGYAYEEYGLVDDKLPVTRAEYDDGAAIIDGKPVDIRGRVALRARYVTPYNFLIAPYLSPINNKNFDNNLKSHLDNLLHGEDVFDNMCVEIQKLPRRN